MQNRSVQKHLDADTKPHRVMRKPLLWLVNVLLLLNSALVAAAPNWSVGANLLGSRAEHTATLLPNGKVLITGGYSYVNVTQADHVTLASTELYDSATNTFTANSPLTTGRKAHTATSLPNGNVLVVGGTGGSGALASAELYNPGNATWSAVGPLARARSGHTATLLPNGNVLVVGGTADTSALASVELYNSATATWSTVTPLARARSGHTATLLPNGNVLVVGGGDGKGDSSAELFNPASNIWIRAAALNSARIRHSATLLPSGSVLVAGGYASITDPTSIERYDPATDTWSIAAAQIKPRTWHTATLLPNGKLLIAGGDGLYHTGASVELYDPARDILTATNSLNTARSRHSATLLNNGKVFIAGGIIAAHDGFNFAVVGAADYLTVGNTELYDPTSQTGSSLLTPPSITRSAHAATRLPDGQVLLLAGGIEAVELYDPASRSWRSVGSLASARYNATATLLGNGKVLVAGGWGGENLFSTELYDPTRGSWTSAGTMSTDRTKHSATRLASGRVLVVGGYSTTTSSGVTQTNLRSVDLYDPANNTWSSTSSLADARQSHTATLLPDGKVLVAGGYAGRDLASAEIYDPQTGRWSATNPLATARSGHTATLLPNGKVLVTSGQGYRSMSEPSAELYDPATGTWAPAGPPALRRQNHTATLLPNGQVLVMGGLDDTPLIYPTSSTELYDPASNTWRPADTLISRVSGHTATLLANGDVLIVGLAEVWRNEFIRSNTAELFDALTLSDARVTAIEYYHSAFDHYFITASPEEAAALDAGIFKGWARSGQSFKAYPPNTPQAANFCRFFSVGFEPKSSHFYTPSAEECALVKKNPHWLHEGLAFAVTLPTSEGLCASGSTPLYRLYNNGQGAAPNHRYTTSLAIQTAMLAQGWVPEGAGPGVIACVPR